MTKTAYNGTAINYVHTTTALNADFTVIVLVLKVESRNMISETVHGSHPLPQVVYVSFRVSLQNTLLLS